MISRVPSDLLSFRHSQPHVVEQVILLSVVLTKAKPCLQASVSLQVELPSPVCSFVPDHTQHDRSTDCCSGLRSEVMRSGNISLTRFMTKIIESSPSVRIARQLRNIALMKFVSPTSTNSVVAFLGSAKTLMKFMSSSTMTRFAPNSELISQD